MPVPRGPDTDQLLRQASEGDAQARGQLLDRHRSRLRDLIALRLDRRLAARVDPSDVVQETLAEAAERLSAYLRKRRLRTSRNDFGHRQLEDLGEPHASARRRPRISRTRLCKSSAVRQSGSHRLLATAQQQR
jgi:RNA polymerase sigma-70 factor (ECF subfamily)